MKKACRNDGQKPWSYRRRVVTGTLCFCAFCVCYVMMLGAADAETGRTIVASAFGMGTLVVGSYIGAAVVHDKGDAS